MISPILYQQLGILYSISGVPFCIASRSKGVLQAFPSDAGPFFTAQYRGEIPEDPPEELHENGIRIYYEETFFALALTNLTEDYYAVTMPVSPVLHEAGTAVSRLATHVPQELQSDYYRLINAAPPTDTARLIHIMTMIKILFTGNEAVGIDFLGIDETPLTQEEVDMRKLDQKLHTSREEQDLLARQIPDHQVELIMDAVENGKENRLQKMLEQYSCGRVERLSPNYVRHMKYSFVSLLQEAGEHAVKGGLSRRTMRQLLALYCQRMDLLKDALSVQNFTVDCLRDFCSRVAKAKDTAGCSPYTKKACSYILENLYRPLRVEDVADYMNLDRRTLLCYFRRDLSMTISEYISEQRLQEAAYLLRSSQMSPSEISDLLQFSHQSHFGKKFRERFGMTPGTYRAKNAQS